MILGVWKDLLSKGKVNPPGPREMQSRSDEPQRPTLLINQTPEAVGGWEKEILIE